MRRALLGMAGAMGVAAPAVGAAADPPRPVVTNPDWESRPSAEDMAARYPALAARLEIGGSATVSCSVTAIGALVGCQAVAESPKELGFGAAAVSMTSLFKMRPQTINGRPSDGGVVRIPIRFALPIKPPPEAPPPASSEAALRQALRLVDTTPAVARTVESLTNFQSRLADAGPSAAARQAADDAVRDAIEGRRGAVRDAFARAFASVFSEEEMQALADFGEGPGKGLQENATLGALQGQVRLVVPQAFRAGAHDAFCAQRPCPTGAELARVWRPADPRDNRLDNPQWAITPTASQVRQKAPALAAAIGLTGAVRLTCRLGKEGAPEDCAVDEQLPAGLGFGEAAADLAAAYRLSPIQLADGAAGRRVTVRVGFTPAPLTEPNPAPPHSAHAAELARPLVDADEFARLRRRDLEVQILKFETRPKSADAKTYDAAIAAFRAGGESAIAAGVERLTAAYAAAYSETELTQLAAFRATAAGKAQRERQGALEVAMAKAAAYVGALVTADARREFCATRGCDAAAAAPGAGLHPIAASPEPSTAKP